MEQLLLINAFFLLLVGVVCGIWFWHWRAGRAGRGQHGDARNGEDSSEAGRPLQQLNAQLQEQQDENRKIELQLTAARESLHNAENRLQERQRQLDSRDQALLRLNREQAGLQADNAVLQTRLEQEKRVSEEKLALLQKAGKDMQNHFENLAQRIFDEHGRKFTSTSKAGMDSVVKPLQEQLGNFRKRLDDIHDRESRDRQNLHNEIVQLKSLNERITQEALNLTRALKGDSRKRGDWGEVILERVLESSGLVKGREYLVQYHLRDEQGRERRPDVIVLLPEDRHVIIDSKVSLNAYTDYCNAEQEADRIRLGRDHLAALRNQVTSLAGKNYPALAQRARMNSPDMVLMFVPVEPALLFACEQDPNLFQDAFREGVILVSPSTLSMNLQLIHNLWRYERQNRNTRRIVEQAAAMHDKFAGFVDALEELGARLDGARDSWQTAHKRLTSGRGNLLKRVSDLGKLGIQGKKSLPAAPEQEAEELELSSDAAPGNQTQAAVSQ